MKWLQNNKENNKKYLYYFSITFMVPIIIILVMNAVLQNGIKKQVLDSGNKVLVQFFTYLDSRLEDMILDVNEIIEEDTIKIFAQKNAENPKMYAYYPSIMQNKLKIYNDKEYADVLVWYAYDDKIVSSKYPSRLIEDYYRYSYNEEDSSYVYQDIGMEKFFGVVRGKTMVPVFARLEDCKGKQYLCITQGQASSKNASYHYAVSIIVERDFLNAMAPEGVLGKDDTILLYDENGELLFSSQKDTMEVLHEDYRKPGTYEVEDAEEEYMLIVQECKILNGYYVMKISQRVFWDALRSARIVSGVGIILSLLLGFLVALKFGNKTQETFEEIVESIKREQVNQDKKRLLEERTKRKRDFLIGVLEGERIEQCTTAIFEENGISLHSERILIGVLSIQNLWDIGEEQISFIITNVFEDTLKECGRCYVQPMSLMKYLIIVNPKKEVQEETLENLLFKGISLLNEQLNFSAVIGCSTIIDALEDICDAYRNAQSALEYHFFLEDKMVISFCDIADKEFSYPIFEDQFMYQMIVGFLNPENGSCMTAEAFVQHLLETYGIRKETAMETVVCFRYDFIKALSRLTIAKKFSGFEREIYMERMAKVKGYTEYCEVLCWIVSDLSDKFKRMSEKESCCKKIWQYVEEHYSDSNLNVAGIGDVFGMQAAYLSKLFKAEYGIALSDYISKVRVNKSKVLLGKKKLTIGEIAEMVGFIRSNIYINNFKRWEGITPGRYRELNKDIEVDTDMTV